jgi:PQQ-like domain
MRLGVRFAAGVMVAITGLAPAVTASAATAVPGGTKLWAAAGPAGSAGSVAVSPDGSSVYVTGGPTVAYAAATGAMRWESAGTTVTGSKTVVSPGGSAVFVTGTSPGSGGSTDYGTAAYDSATGAQLWTASYHGPGTGSDAADAIAVSPDGSQVFVTGESSNGTGSTTGFATVAYDASTGAQLWAARYDGPAAGLDDAVAVAVSPDGSKVFITGHSLGANGISGFTTLAYQAATGATVWTQRYNQGNRNATAAALVLSPDGSTVYVTARATAPKGRTPPRWPTPQPPGRGSGRPSTTARSAPATPRRP